MSVKFGESNASPQRKRLSRDELAELIGTSAPIVGRYERGDMMSSIEIATKISEALGVSLDFLVGKSSLVVKDKNMLERLEDIAKLPATKQTELFNVIDAYLWDYRTSKAYAK